MKTTYEYYKKRRQRQGPAAQRRKLRRQAEGKSDLIVIVPTTAIDVAGATPLATPIAPNATTPNSCVPMEPAE